MVKVPTGDGKELSYDKLLEDKSLPPYWQRKYRLAYRRFRKFYGIGARNSNPMHEILLEKIAYLSTKMMYYESPDFFAETGVPIENPVYMGKYDTLIKSMVKLVEQMQKYTEPKPVTTIKKKNLNLSVNTTAKELKELSNADLDNEIARLLGGAKGTPKEITSGETAERE